MAYHVSTSHGKHTHPHGHPHITICPPLHPPTPHPPICPPIHTNNRQDEGASIHSASHRTLFVDITGATPLAIQELRPIIENNFAVWGPLEYVKVLRERAVVFVRYAMCMMWVCC